MRILGVKYLGSHDPSACLVENGNVTAFAEEERFTRIKHAPYRVPIQAVAFCLKQAGITIRDIDYIACPRGAPGYQRKHVLPYVLRQLPIYLRMHPPYTVALLLESVVNPSALSLSLALKKRFGHVPEIVSIPHDLAHLASAYYPSPFRDAKLLCLEGCAEKNSAAFGQGTDSSIETLHHLSFPNSLGLFYGVFTEWLGFRALKGEGKVMGLAPYGMPDHDLSHILAITADGFEYDWRYGGVNGRIGRRLIKEFGRPRSSRDPIREIHRDVAASVQSRLETVGLHLLEILSGKVASGSLCLAGGIALNVKLNGLFLRSKLVDEVFVQPAANDAGLALGAALELSARLGEEPTYVMEHAYLGPGFNSDEIREALESKGLRFEHHGEIENVTADLLVEGQIVGWFQGRMEAGPRALGNRSILADPRDPGMKARINKRVKFRESFRPFCPSLIDEAKEDLLEDARSSPFMTIAFKARNQLIQRAPSVVHVDGSVRPQTVKEKANPRFHKLLRQFGSKSGIPVLLNTSLNVRGEPICCNPEDAIACFLGTGMDALVLGNYLIRK